jgi:hypothetical protein
MKEEILLLAVALDEAEILFSNKSSDSSLHSDMCGRVNKYQMQLAERSAVDPSPRISAALTVRG